MGLSLRSGLPNAKQSMLSTHMARGVGRLLVGVYVNILVVTSNDAREIERFKLEMKNQFNMSDLGLLTFYLGIEVKQDGGGISLSQAAYAKKILSSSGMDRCNSCHVPIEPRFKL